MRNRPWAQASEMARRFINFRNYHHHTDVWLPKDLAQGDIVRCDLPTDFMRTGEPEICPRNCLVLGIDLNRETKEIESLRLARFSYFTLDCDEGHEWLIYPRDKGTRGLISGFRDKVVMRTQRIDVVPVASEFFGFYMDRIGRVDPSLFNQAEAKLRLARETTQRGSHFQFHGERSTYDTVTVPSLDPARFGRGFSFTMPARMGQDYADMMPAAQEDFRNNLAENRIARDIDRVLMLKHEKGVRSAMTQAEREGDLAIRRIITALRHDRKQRIKSATLEKLIDTAAKRLATIDRNFQDKMEQQALESGETSPLKLADIPDYRTVLRRHFGIEQEPLKAPSVIIASFTRAVDQNSLNDLQNLGVGGLLREPSINLPQHLWQGRYLMMRIADLNDPSNYGQAFRPCAIWKAFARVNGQGEPVLAGFEMHPVTRSSAGESSYKMRVRPMETVVRKPSYLIADMMIRAPLDATYFQPEQREDFYFELLPHMVRELEVKRELALGNGGIKTFGLHAAPQDWVEIPLPPPPNEKLRARLVHTGKARFTPVSAPDVRPMAGSRNTARNYKFTPKS